AAEISRIHFQLERNERERIRREADVAGLLTPAEIRALVARIEKDSASQKADAGEDLVLKPIPFRGDPSSATDDALGTPEELRKLVKEPARGAEGLGG
ncbi:MAG: hypothetical protein ACKO3W_11440, partial [bacterium]